MNKRDLALHEATHENIVTVADGPRYREYLAPFGMRPPAPANRRSSNELSERRHRPTCRLEDDTVLLNERKSLP
jgi:hypothetical protein